MSPYDLEIIQALRVLLFLGALFVLAVLFIDLMGQPPPKADPRMARRRVAQDEECKLHARKLSECKRLGYHKDPEDSDDA